MTQQIKYKRVLLKLSGESLMGSDPFGINHDTIVQTVGEIAEIVRMGVQVGIVVGGGNIFRGVSAQAGSMDRATADYMGMMATVMNAWHSKTHLKPWASKRAYNPHCLCSKSLKLTPVLKPFNIWKKAKS